MNTLLCWYYLLYLEDNIYFPLHVVISFSLLRIVFVVGFFRGIAKIHDILENLKNLKIC